MAVMVVVLSSHYYCCSINSAGFCELVLMCLCSDTAHNLQSTLAQLYKRAALC